MEHTVDQPRELRYVEAVREALTLKMTEDPSVYVMGLGVPDPKGVFGTTIGLQESFGPERVMDMPLSECGMTGVAVGSAIMGMRPVMVHQRLDFVLLALEQIVNQAAKWHYMFDRQHTVPIVVRMVVGRGWGQGPQHSQSLHSWFAHVPGLKVILPFSPADAKGLLISAIEDDNPVIMIEHRWLHNTFGPVPEGIYRSPLGKAGILRAGEDLTLVTFSQGVMEGLRTADALHRNGVEVELIDLRTLRPWDKETVLASVRKTGRLMVADPGWKTGGFGAEVTATVAEEAYESLKAPPIRIAMPDCPVPTSWSLSVHCYPDARDMVRAAGGLFDLPESVGESLKPLPEQPADVPYRDFTGPF